MNNELFCPFKYPQYTYCDCPYQGKERLLSEDFQSLEDAWKCHLIELSDNDIDITNIARKPRDE